MIAYFFKKWISVPALILGAFTGYLCALSFKIDAMHGNTRNAILIFLATFGVILGKRLRRYDPDFVTNLNIIVSFGLAIAVHFAHFGHSRFGVLLGITPIASFALAKWVSRRY